MNILLWAPYGAGEHYWGPGMSAYRLYKAGLPKGVKIFLAHGFKDQKDYPDLFENQFFIPELNRESRLSDIKFLWNSKKWINKNYHRFDVIHVLGLYERSFRPSIWFEKKGVPTYCKITSIGEGLSEQSLISKLIGLGKYRKNNISKITGFIAISDEIKKSLVNYGIDENKIFQIPNGVNTGRFKPVDNKIKKELRDELNLRDVFIIIFVGGISKRKQPFMIAEAVKELVKKEGKDILFILLGPDRDGIELEKINSFILTENLSKNILHIENSINPEKFYQASDVFCLPSKREGMSNALLEAMACGLPSLVTPISGSVDLVIEDKNGFYVTNPSSIRKNVLHYLINKDKLNNHSAKSVEIIKEGFSSEKVLSEHLKLFMSK